MLGCTTLSFTINHNTYFRLPPVFCQFSDIHISQGSVATYIRCGGIFKQRLCYKFTVESAGERILKIGWRSYGQKFSSCFLTHGVVMAYWHIKQ